MNTVGGSATAFYQLYSLQLDDAWQICCTCFTVAERGAGTTHPGPHIKQAETGAESHFSRITALFSETYENFKDKSKKKK